MGALASLTLSEAEGSRRAQLGSSCRADTPVRPFSTSSEPPDTILIKMVRQVRPKQVV